MNAGHFSENLVSSGDLNRSPGVQRVATLGVFLRYFLHAAKSTNPFPCRELSRFCEPRISTQNYKFALTKLNPFAALRRPFPTFCKVQKVGQKTLELSFRKVCPIRCSTLRVLCAALRRHLSAAMPPFFVAAATFFRLVAVSLPDSTQSIEVLQTSLNAAFRRR